MLLLNWLRGGRREAGHLDRILPLPRDRVCLVAVSSFVPELSHIVFNWGGPSQDSLWAPAPEQLIGLFSQIYEVLSTAVISGTLSPGISYILHGACRPRKTIKVGHFSVTGTSGDRRLNYDKRGDKIEHNWLILLNSQDGAGEKRVCHARLTLGNDCSIKNIFHEKKKPVKLNYTFVILD